MNCNNDRNTADSEKMFLVKNKSNELFLYYDKFKVLVPMKQDLIEKEYGTNVEIGYKKVPLNNIIYKSKLIRANHAVELFKKMLSIPEISEWNIEEKLWFVDNTYSAIPGLITEKIVFDGTTKKISRIRNRKARILRVIYIQGESNGSSSKGRNLEGLKKLGLSVVDTNNKYRTFKKENLEKNLQELLDCDKNRCGLASYEQEMLYDIKAGHWDVFENPEAYEKYEKLVPRDPKSDIKKNGVIGIDFGTKSTVVVKQEGSNEIRPIRIGSLSLKAEVSESDYENPTIISCMSINSFLKSYTSKLGRPETSCNDLFVSYNAYDDYKNCTTENFYAYYLDLKQWSNHEKEDAVVLDIRDRKKFFLGEESSIEKCILNPIEVYAYYIGMYINNMRNGIYLKYIMSFPVKYSKATKELIRKSFEKGLKKSIPTTVVADKDLMSKFSVQYQISEPAAYAVTALEQSGFKPKSENEKYLYGIFDFGGGTTDFDFGVWRGASDDEYDKFNCDYVLECFGADSDAHLGGENILEMLAYQVFKDNKVMAADKKVSCALPVDEVPFIGGENLINNSQSANRNLTLLKEALRPLWEQYENWQSKYLKKKSTNVQEGVKESKEECIDIQLYNINGKPVPNCVFEIDTSKLLDLIKERIRKGVKAFFNCIEKSILHNKVAQYASEKVYIFLAGNSCKSRFVKEIFEETIMEYNKEYGLGRDQEQDRFQLIDPLKSYEMDTQYIPNAKTSVAYGLVKSRPGGKIYVKKNYETDFNEETKFKYYLGGDRRGNFDCKLAPMIIGEDGESKTSYNIWRKFQGAGMGAARIYYTEDPRADSNVDKLDISKIPFHEITFEPEEDKYLYVRAVKPSVIEYAIASLPDQISEKVEEMDIDR